MCKIRSINWYSYCNNPTTYYYLAHDTNIISNISTTRPSTITNIHIICILFLYACICYSLSYSRRIKSTLYICNYISNFSLKFSFTNLDIRTAKRSHTHIYTANSSYLHIWNGNLYNWIIRTTTKINFILLNGSAVSSCWSLIRCIFMNFFLIYFIIYFMELI